MLLDYLQYFPAAAAPDVAASAALIGRATAGAHLRLRDCATVRADGEWVRMGANVYFGERATVHIADGVLGTHIGDEVTVGRYGLVHACTLGEGVVVGEAASVLDGAVVGPYALLAGDSLVPPRKQLQGGWMYAGNPAHPVREITRAEVAEAARDIRAGRASSAIAASALPPLSLASFVPDAGRPGPLHAYAGHSPRITHAFIAPTSAVVGMVDVGDSASIFFGCVVAAGGARIVVGPRTNVQDNSILVTDRSRGDLVIGAGATIGHNAQMGPADIGENALIGMGSRLSDEVVVEANGCVAAGAWVEPGAVVRSGWIWAGRPARPFREIKPAEREAFARFRDIYVGYSAAYRAPPRRRDRG
jgi:carbonic anhydrase/acetyltransferase-like protein (isoleucine patch superfamily)